MKEINLVMKDETDIFKRNSFRMKIVFWSNESQKAVVGSEKHDCVDRINSQFVEKIIHSPSLPFQGHLGGAISLSF